MQVILMQDVYKHGVAGETVNVADGFARNYLIPKKLAVRATAEALRQNETLRAAAAERKMAYEDRLNQLARQIDGTELVFGRRASPTGKLFGSVTTSEIADALNTATGVDINRRRISTNLPREVGTHDVPVRLGSENPPTLRVIIVREEEYNRFMAERAAAAAAAANPAPEAGEGTDEIAITGEATSAGDVIATAEPVGTEAQAAATE